MRPLHVILSGAREDRILYLSEGRGVEGSRPLVLCDGAPGSSAHAASCEFPEAGSKLYALSGSFDSPRSQSSLGIAQDDSRRSYGHYRRRKYSRKMIRALAFTILFVLCLCTSAVHPERTQADARPLVELNVDQAVPREVNDTVQQAVARDYSAAWQTLAVALADNNAAALNDNFVGFAQDKLTQRIKDQQQAGLRTRIVDRGHKVAAVFFSTEGATIELEDTVHLETQILDADTVLHSERAQLHYWVVMTGAEDRWKVRVMEDAE